MMKYLLKKILAQRKVGFIFAGHGVAIEWKNKKIETIHISFSDFKAIIELLESLDFDFLCMDEVVALSKNKFSHTKHWTHISFDDGYQNNYDVVYPFLKNKGIPFSIYVSTSYIESRDRFPTFWVRLAQEYGKDLEQIYRQSKALGEGIINPNFEQLLINLDFKNHNELIGMIKKSFTVSELNKIDEQYYNDKPMTLDSILKLSNDSLVHLGAHSHLHIACHKNQHVDSVMDSIRQSIFILRDKWSVNKNPTFCYPNGDHDSDWGLRLEKINIPLAFSSDAGFISKDTNIYAIPRFWFSTRKKAYVACVLSLFGSFWLMMAKKILGK